MMMLALPMTLLFIASEIVARLIDRRRRTALDELDDDEISELDEEGHESYTPSGLGEDED